MNALPMTRFLFFVLALSFISCHKEPVVAPTGNSSSQADAQMSTNFSDDWDNWTFRIGDTTVTVRTTFSEDWDSWRVDFGSGFFGNISTTFSEDWDNWNLNYGGYSIRMRTAFSEDWDNWDIDDFENDWHADLRTAFSDDWDSWDAYDDVHIADIQTRFSEDYDSWNCYANFPEWYPIEYRIAILFIPVVTAVLNEQGLIE